MAGSSRRSITIKAKEDESVEKTFKEYARFINDTIKEETIKKNMAANGLVGHFSIEENGTFKPRNYPGFTLITPTYGDDADNSALYKILTSIQDNINRKLSSRKYVTAPESALHMTVARLISGDLFEKNVLYSKERELLEAFRLVFSKLPALQYPELEIKGISFMPQGIIAAMVTAKDEASYYRLQSFRDVIYSDKALCEFGVERKRGFKGHITLMYIEKELTADEKAILAETIIQANIVHFSKPYPFHLSRAEVRRFNNYLGFTREENWPSIEFCKQTPDQYRHS